VPFHRLLHAINPHLQLNDACGRIARGPQQRRRRGVGA
jgi:hypothetical protein